MYHYIVAKIFYFNTSCESVTELFLDIETAPDLDSKQYFEIKSRIDSGDLDRDSEDRHLFWRFQQGGLTPFEGKVILITYKIANGHTFRLKEWDSGERAILESFYDTISRLHRSHGPDHLRIVGHNILGFDLFFLYQRMVHHEIAQEKWLYQRIINKPEVIDFLQLHLPLNDFQTKGLKHDVLALAYGFSTKNTQGSGEIPHYFEGAYEKILQYSEREFIYPQLYKNIYSNGLVSKDTLQEAIRQYDKPHSV